MATTTIQVGATVTAEVLGKDLEGVVTEVDGDELTVEITAPWDRCKAGELVEVYVSELVSVDGVLR